MLDFAIQCSPDHPWVREHPEWFRQAPLEVVTPEEDLQSLWENHHRQFLASSLA